MQVNDWERVQEIFLEAADLSPSEQTEFLDRACGNTALRTDVESLLREDADAEAALDTVIQTEAASILSEELLLVGGRLGAYRIIQEIGRGGMGSVYLAERDDHQYHKRVAIKVVKRGMDTVEVLRRFRHERQILAGLEHPYIARLIDGGTTPDGRPFFVMEKVEGQPINAHCAAHKLDLESHLRLFLRVCEAVSYAHRALVVHRDLKPGNILVTTEGVPKLLDFGVAKLLDPGADPGLTATRAGPLTPEYASPEQVLGLPITTATDVYALGAILFELLTGTRAQTIETVSQSEIERVVCETQPQRPSVLAKRLNSDLDNIVLMAMRKEPARRYGSVAEFAADLQRYLERRPVLARQDSFSYRTGKFLRRNRLAIAATAVVLVSLVGALVVSQTQSRRAEAARRASEVQRVAAEYERARAEEESRQAGAARQAEARQRALADQQRARAEQRATELIDLANRTLFDVHDAIQSLPGAMTARRTIVKTTLDYLEGLEKDIGLDDRMRMVVSSAYYKVGKLQGDPTGPSQEDYVGAEATVRKSEALLAPLYKQTPDDPSVLLNWLQVEGFLAELAFRSGRAEEAIAANLKLLPVAHRLGELRPSDLTSARQEAEVYSRLSFAIRAIDSAQALKYRDLYVAAIRGLLTRFPGDTDLKGDYGSALAGIAGILRSTGELEKSADYYLQSIGMREELLRADPHNARIRRDLLVAYGNYAMILGVPWTANLGRFDDAHAAAAHAVEIGRELANADPENATARYDLANALARLGMVDIGPESASAALASLQEAIGIMEPMMKANPASTTIATQLTLAREYAGHRLEQLGQIAAAGKEYRLSLEESKALSAGVPTMAMQAFVDEEALALLDASAGNREEALIFANRAVADAEKTAAEKNRSPEDYNGHLANAYFVLASVLKDFGDWEQADQAAERALTIWHTIRNPSVLILHHRAIGDAEAMLRDAEARRDR